MNIAAALDKAIKAVCPIHGVSLGKLDDRATWRIDFKDEATEVERTAAQAVLQSFDPSKVKEKKAASADAILAALVKKGVIAESDL